MHVAYPTLAVWGTILAVTKLPFALGIAGILTSLFGLGCMPLQYLGQAGAGQDDLNRRAIPIEQLLEENRLTPKLRPLLAQVKTIKKFGEANGLRPTPNYERYVNLDRPAAVWIVSASEPLRFRSKTWSFPVTGNITVLGWFDEKKAQEFGDGLRKEGWDVDVRPSSAYSTLGWFEDSILSTMIPDGDEAMGSLANVILHESLHATYYIPGQTRLNESVANFVGDTLAKRYMESTVGLDSKELRSYLAAETWYNKRADTMHAAHDKLEALYASSIPREEKLAEKTRIIAELKKKTRMKRPVTNATLLQYETYNSGQDEMKALLAVCEGSVPRFLATLERLKAKRLTPQEKSLNTLVAPLVSEGCVAK